MIYDEIALWGLTDESSLDEIWDVINERLLKTDGRMGIATLKDGLPHTRIISIQRFSDGNLYIMTSKGKPFYRQLKETPYISASSLMEDNNHCIRLHSEVEEVTDPACYKEYADHNPGTMKMYRNNPDLIVLFRLCRGTGEILHLYRDDMIRRLRFGWGGAEPEPLSYYVDETACIGCGHCFENCAEHAIFRTEEGKYQIRNMDCDDCGICFTKCPLAGTALKNRWD